MAFLLDTHSFLWWCEDSPQLSTGARKVIAKQDCFVSLVSFRDIAIKFSPGKLGLPAAPEIMRCASLPLHHRDPFDRLLIAQAMERELTLVSRDSSFDSYGIQRVW